MVRHWIDRAVPYIPDLASLPYEDQSKIRQLIEEVSPIEISPVIELTIDQLNHITAEAKCGRWGHKITFVKQYMENPLDRVAQIIIAHEIAHAMHNAETTLLNKPHPPNDDASSSSR